MQISETKSIAKDALQNTVFVQCSEKLIMRFELVDYADQRKQDSSSVNRIKM